jgi:DNA-binding NarL/FixJ family response regulator
VKRILLIAACGSSPVSVSLETELDLEPDLHVVAHVAELADACARASQADIAILRLGTCTHQRDAYLTALRSANPNICLLELSALAGSDVDPRHVRLPATAPEVAVLEQVRALGTDAARTPATGNGAHALRVADMPPPAFQVQGQSVTLTPSERDILRCLVQGMRDQDIAHALGLTSRAAHDAILSILSKLAVESRLQAIVTCLRTGLLSPDHYHYN